MYFYFLLFLALQWLEEISLTLVLIHGTNSFFSLAGEYKYCFQAQKILSLLVALMLKCLLTLANSNLCHFSYFLCSSPWLQDICSLPNNAGPWPALGFLPLHRASPSRILSAFFRVLLFGSNPLWSGKRVGSGLVASFCRWLSCNMPVIVCIWDGAWTTQGALSLVRAVCASLLESCWKLLSRVV